MSFVQSMDTYLMGSTYPAILMLYMKSTDNPTQRSMCTPFLVVSEEDAFYDVSSVRGTVKCLV